MKNPDSKHSITVHNKQYPYFLSAPYKEDGYEVVFFECKAASISQPFLREDIPALLVDLPNLIIAEKKYQKKQKDIIRFRVTVEDKKRIEKRAAREGYSSVSSFLRHLALKDS
jgi:hypothetical protein